MTDPHRIAELEASARHAADRYRLYRARSYGPRATSPARLQELKREAEIAERMLERMRNET